MDTGPYDFMNQGCWGWEGKDIFVPMKTGRSEYKMRAKQITHLKTAPVPAVELPDEPPNKYKIPIPKFRSYSGIAILAQDANRNTLVNIPNTGTWWIYAAHWDIGAMDGRYGDFCKVNRNTLRTGEMSWRTAKSLYDGGGKYTVPCGIVFYGVHQSNEIVDYDYWSPYGKLSYPATYCPDDP